MKKISAVFIIVLFLFSGCKFSKDKTEKADSNSDAVKVDTSVEHTPSTHDASQYQKNNEIDEGDAVIAETQVAEEIMLESEKPHGEEEMSIVSVPADMEEKTVHGSSPVEVEVPATNATAIVVEEQYDGLKENTETGQLPEGINDNSDFISDTDEGETVIAETRVAGEKILESEKPHDEGEESIVNVPADMEAETVHGSSPVEMEVPAINATAINEMKDPSDGLKESTEAVKLPEGVHDKTEIISDKGEVNENGLIVEDVTENTVEPAVIIPEGNLSVEELWKTESVPVEEASDVTDTISSEVVADMSELEAENRIALFPLENLTNETDVLKHVMPVLKYHLERKGVNVVHGGNLENYLCKERVRSAGLISKDLAIKVKDKFHVKAILTGSIISFASDDHPKFGILVRLVDSSSGTILWADYASATGDDYTTILGLGRIKSIYSLVPRVMENLFASFNVETLNKETRNLRKVLVMPFLNNSNYKNAGKIAMYLFLGELLKNQQFEPIEYGITRQQLIKSRIRNRGELDHEKIRSLSEPLGAEGLLLGVVESYINGAENSLSPKVSITARLIDSSKSRIVWYNSHQLSGEDEVIALDWGRVRSVHNVAHNVVVHLVKQMGKATWP